MYSEFLEKCHFLGISKKMSRTEVIKRINKAQELVSANDFGAAKEEINWCIDKITEYNFYPLLDILLELDSKINEKEENASENVLDLIIRQSAEIRSVHSKELIEKLIEISKQPKEIETEIPLKYFNISPLKAKVLFACSEIFSGKDIDFELILDSEFSKSLQIDDITITFKAADGSLCAEKIGSNYELKPNYPLKLHKTFLPSITTQSLTVANIKLKIQNITLILMRKEDEKITIIPDENSCKIDVSLPERCIIGTKLPLTITLTSGEDELKDLTISLLYDDQQSPITISGEYNGKKVEKVTKIGDVAPNTVVKFDLTILTPIPISTDIILSVMFSTQQFENAVFKKPIKFNFISAFDTYFRYFSEDLEELIGHNQKPVLEEGSKIIVETKLRNSLTIPLTIKKFSGSLDYPDINPLPTTINANETFTFIGFLTKPGPAQVIVHYSAENIDDAFVCFNTPPVKLQKCPLSFVYEHPNEAVVNKEFDVKLIIHKPEGDPNDPEFSEYVVFLDKTPYFFNSGFGKQTIILGKNQTKEIKVTFLPLVTGSSFIPRITIFDPKNREAFTKTFLAPIIIAYQ